MALLAAALLGLIASLPEQTTWPTLRQELQNHKVDPAHVDDADRRITSYAVGSTVDWFAIAYYWHTGSDLLPRELRIRTLNRKTGVWRHNVLDTEAVRGGAAMAIARAPDVVYLDLHINPSAGAVIVLGKDLTVKKRLYGWTSLLLPDGRLVYENSMVHFAPAQPASVSMYDPRTGRDVRLYPAQREPMEGMRWIDRSISGIERSGSNQIQIRAAEQEVVIGADNRATPSGPRREQTVTCDISRAMPKCIVRPRQTARPQ